MYSGGSHCRRLNMACSMLIWAWSMGSYATYVVLKKKNKKK